MSRFTGLWKLKLKIVNCLNVPIADPNGKSDPFVQVYMDNQFIGMTHVKKEDLNPVFNFQFPSITLTTLDTTLRFEIYDEDIGKDNDLLGIVKLRLDQIVDGTQTLHVEAVELKQGQLQSLVQMGHTVMRGATGPFTMTIDANILESISFSEDFLSLPKVESLVANPPTRISFVPKEDWETLSVLQQEEIVNYAGSLKQLGYSDGQVKEDVLRFLSDLHHIRRPSNESINIPPSQAIYREDPAIKNSTKFMILNDGRFIPSFHTPIYPQYCLQLNLTEDERAFRLIIFRSRYVLLSWFEWIQAAFAYWKGGMKPGQFHLLQSFMEDLCEVKSNIDIPDSPSRRVEVKLDLSNPYNIKIGNKILSLDQLSSIVISVDSVRPTNIVAEVQVTAAGGTSYDSCELSDGFRRFTIDLKTSEKVGTFDFHPEEGKEEEDEDISQMNRVVIEGKNQNKVIGSGVLNLHGIFTHALAAGIIQDSVDGMRVFSRVLMSEIREYRIHDLTVVMMVPIYTNLSIQASLMDEKDQPIGRVQTISLVRDSRTPTIIRATLPEVIFQASLLSPIPTTIKMEISAPTIFGMKNILLGSYKLVCEQMTENDERKVVELESNAKLHFTCNCTTHRHEVETMSTFRPSCLRNNLWYGECGNLNSKFVQLLVFPDHHQLQLFSKGGDDSIDKIKLFHGIPWSNIRHVRPLTPAILSVHYHHGLIPQCLYLFNCPSDELASLFAERIEVAKARDLVGRILSNGEETCQIPQIFRLFNTVVEAISLVSGKQVRIVKRSCIKKLYLLEVLQTRDWHDFGATRLHEEVLKRCSRIEESFPVSSTSFSLVDFRNMIERIDVLFSELEELFCIAIMKAVKEMNTCRVTSASSMKILLSATSVLQEFTRRIFHVIGPCFSSNFHYFLQSYADTLYSSQNAWRRIMLLYQQMKKKLEDLQSIYEKVFGLKFKARIPSDDHLPFSYLQDSFITSFIIDMKKTIYNHLKSAMKGISSMDRFIAVQDFVIAQRRALYHGKQMLIDFHQKDCDLVLNGIDLAAIKHEIFSLEDVNRRAGFIFLDVLLSMARRVEEEILPNSEDEWNLLVFEPGSSNTTVTSDLMMQEKWRRCVDYSIQIIAFASGLQASERSIWKNLTEVEELRIIPEKANCVQLLHYHCNERMIGHVLDHLSSGLCQYLHYLKLLPDQIPSDPSSFMRNLTDLLSYIEHYLIEDRKEHHLWEQIAANLRDRVLSKCLILFFGALANETSSFSLNHRLVRQLGHNIETLYGSIKLYLMNQHHVDSEVGWLCLLQTHYPLAGFALLAFSLLHSFITVKPNELSQVVALLVQSYSDCMMSHKSLDSSAANTMKTAISHYLHMCFHLRLRYYSDEGIPRLDSLVQECEEALSLIHLESTMSTENISHLIPLNSIAVVFGKSRGYPLPNKPEGSSTSRTPFAANFIAWDVKPQDDLLRSYVLRRPATKQSSPGADGSIRARRSSWSSFILTPAVQPSVDHSRSDEYSLLSQMHLLYSRSESDEVSSKIKNLHRFDQIIPRYHQNRMKSQQSLSSSSAAGASSLRPPDRILLFTEIQLLNMFYLPNNNLLRSLTNSSFYLYMIIQIGDQWIYATEKVVGEVFNANLLPDPIRIPIYHPLTSFTGSTSSLNGNAVKSQYLSEDIVIYVVYSTNDSNAEVNLLNDRIIGLCQTTIYHYHPLNQHRTPGRFLINTKDEYVERAQTAALNEGRKLPSLTFSYLIL